MHAFTVLNHSLNQLTLAASVFDDMLGFILTVIICLIIGFFIGWFVRGDGSDHPAVQNAPKPEDGAQPTPPAEAVAAAEASQAPAPAAGSVSSAMAIQAFSPDIQSGKAKDDPSLGLVYTEAPDNPDDLTEISGVGSVINRQLNEHGIYTFKQIALWSSAQVEEFSKQLKFRDRVAREDWISQAKKLHEQHHAEKL